MANRIHSAAIIKSALAVIQSVMASSEQPWSFCEQAPRQWGGAQQETHRQEATREGGEAQQEPHRQHHSLAASQHHPCLQIIAAPNSMDNHSE